jgi:hypothetical protein
MPYVSSEESQYMMPVHYRIRLYSKGRIEIFQHVFVHQIHVRNGRLAGIEIQHGPDSPGSQTRSVRPLDDVYDIKILDEPVEDYGENWQGPNKNVELKFF